MSIQRLRPPLPHDIMRLIFELAAVEDRKTALKLVVVSQLVQRWIELILYSIVNLHRDTTCRAFLRTIETSRTKSRSFFATHVKSLSISYDIYNDRLARIITACHGITSLTFWVVPSPWHPTTYPHHEITAALDPLRPKRLSVLLTGVLSSPYPRFDMPFFHRLTHLSIVNKWEDWSGWWGFELLPCLTHLSFDFHVGPRSLYGKTASVIAQAIGNILASCPHLRVCILLLIFDPSPTLTAATVLDVMEEDHRRDPRVVFMRDTEPFLDREAHSMREADIWKLAEQTVVRQQRYSNKGHVVLEV